MHAEFILNLTWLAAACGVFALVLRTGENLPRSTAAKLIVAALLALVLFPAISMTDDLHTPVILSSEGDRLYSLEQMTLVAVIFALLFLAAIRLPVISRFTADRERSIPRDGFDDAISGRAPPFAA